VLGTGLDLREILNDSCFDRSATFSSYNLAAPSPLAWYLYELSKFCSKYELCTRQSAQCLKVLWKQGPSLPSKLFHNLNRSQQIRCTCGCRSARALIAPGSRGRTGNLPSRVCQVVPRQWAPSRVHNGYLPVRRVQTGIGDISVKAPKVRDCHGGGACFNSRLLLVHLKRRCCC